MNPNIRKELKTEANRASTLSRQAIEAMKGGDFNLGRSLMKDAAMAGKKCQVLLHEIKQAKKLSQM
jgi:hypothetical protein